MSDKERAAGEAAASDNDGVIGEAAGSDNDETIEEVAGSNDGDVIGEVAASNTEGSMEEVGLLKTAKLCADAVSSVTLFAAGEDCYDGVLLNRWRRACL